MAGRTISAVTAAVVATTTAAKSMAYIKAGSNTPTKVRRMHLGPQGTSNTEPRIAWSLHVAAAGTHGGGSDMTVAQCGGIGKGVGTVQLTGKSAQSVAITGAASTAVKKGSMLPNGPLDIPLNIDLNPGEELLLVCTTGTSQNMDISFECEE